MRPQCTGNGGAAPAPHTPVAGAAPAPHSGHQWAAEMRDQARDVRRSPLSAALLRGIAEDLDAGGVTVELLASAMPGATRAPGPRLLGALHGLVLRGLAPDLAAYYPSAGGRAPVHDAARAAVATWAEHGAEVARALRQPARADEVARAALVYAGLCVIAARYALPLRFFDVGCGAGLTLNADRYAYVINGRTHGDPASPVRLVEPWRTVPAADLSVPVVIVDRRGCDLEPVDPRTQAGRLELAAHLPADDITAVERLRAACALAAEHPVPVAAIRASAWLPQHVGWPRPGAVSVVWHGVVRDGWNPMRESDRAELGEMVEAAGERATETAPFAQLRLTPPSGPGSSGQPYELWLTTWPGGERELLATAASAGIPATWVADR